MAIKNLKKKQLISSVMTLGLSVTMLMGTTLAWFTDTATTSTNTIVAGNLDVDIMYNNGNGWQTAQGRTLQFEDENGLKNGLWQPGATFTLPELKIKNRGNIPLKFKLMVNGVVGDADLAEVIDVYSITEEGTTNEIGTLRELMNDSDGAAYGNLLANTETTSYKLAFKMQEGAGNEYQGQSISGISFTVLATQVNNETEVIVVSSENQFIEAINNMSTEGGTVVLTNNLYFNIASLSKSSDGSVFKIDKNVTVNLNGCRIDADLNTESEVATSLFNVKPGGTLTITGNGAIHAKANQSSNKVSAIINNESGNVVIQDGIYTMGAGSYDQGYLIPTLIDNNSNLGDANVTINGGTFEYHRNMFRNFANAAGHNNYSYANIVINGGEFIGTDEDGAAIWNQRPSDNQNKDDNYGTVTVNGGTFNKVKIDNEWSTSAVVVQGGINIGVNHE